jgi:hypothetical protein
MKKAVFLSILVVAVHVAIGAMADLQQASRPVLDPVYDPAYKGTTHVALGGPFLIEVNDSFFLQTASYPQGETMADGAFLFVGVKIFNNSDRSLQIPHFTAQDFRGRTYLTAIRARRSSNAILAGESLNPGVSKEGYLIFDIPLLSGSESLPLRYKLLIANSRHTIDVHVYKRH